MKSFLRAALLLSVFSALPARAETLPLKRVVITTSGLALYEHEGSVTGNATIDLPVRLDRVDDILKSLVVLDDKGQLGGVSLPGRAPLAELFRGLPFGQEDLSSQMQLLNALRGASVRVTANGQTAEGRLVGVTEETETTKDGGTITRHRVTIATASGLRSFTLETLTSLQFTDKGVQEQLDRALGTLFTNRVKDERTASVTLRGEGTRTVGIAYIQAAPLWKSTYRLVLPADDDKGGKAALQGWAVLENTTGQDWKGVSVTLMSGAPVTYHQALYESYYLPRPELPLKVMGLILPKPDEGAMEEAKDKEEGLAKQAEARDAAAPAPAMKAMMARREDMSAAAPAMAGMAMAENFAVAAASPQPGLAATVSAPASETASQMLFAFPQPVDLPAGNSLMVPFIARELPAEKLWVYQPDTNAEHPLAAIRVKNDGASGLPPGILTLYSQATAGLVFIGDADMPLVPKGEDRFVTFALDTKTKMDRETQDDRHLGLITINKGMLSQKIIEANTTTYTIKAPPDEARTIIIEHPRRPDWQLSKPDGLAAPPEMTSTAHRLRLDVPAGQQKTVKVTLTHDGFEAIALVQSSPQDLDTRMLAAGRDLSPAIRSALEKVKSLQSAVFAQQQELNAVEQERQAIVNDQERLRQNIKTVSPDSTIGKRYMKTLDEQENKMDALTQREQTARAKWTAAQAALQDYVAGLTL